MKFETSRLFGHVGIVVNISRREAALPDNNGWLSVEHRCLLGSPLHLRRLLMNIINNAESEISTMGGGVGWDAAKSWWIGTAG